MALDVGELGFVRASQWGKTTGRPKVPFAWWIGVFGLKFEKGRQKRGTRICFSAPKNRYLKCCRKL